MKLFMYIEKSIKRILMLIISFLSTPFWFFSGFSKRDEKLWLFSSWFGKRYSDNSRVFSEYLMKNHKDINCVWVLKDKKIIQQLNKQGIKAVHANSLERIKLSLRASKIFLTIGDEFSFLFCRGVEIYSLWHGMPLKKICNDDDFSRRGEKKIIGIANMMDKKIKKYFFPWKDALYYDNTYSVTCSDFFTTFLMSAFLLPESRFIKCGLPRCDALFYNKEEPLLSRIRETYPDSRILLYMPTFRTSSWSGKVFNPFSSDYGFNMDEFLAVLEEKKCVFLYKPHFYDENIISKKEKMQRFITIKNDDLDELYNFLGQVDIMMTDYSSVYFDFIITKKPVILAPFDYEEYLSTARGHYFSYFDEMEGVIAKNWDDIIDIIKKEKYFKISEKKIDLFDRYNDGNSCEKLYNFIQEKSCLRK